MEKQTGANTGILTFLVGGAVGVGAGLLLSRVCRTGQATQGKSRDGESSAETYCAVPEGADICFPET
jgi:hypothetical protein